MENANGQVPMGQDIPEANGATLVGGLQGIWDKMKGPIAFFALGFIACKVMDRKKLIKV